jgi:hypothetical protein
MSLYALHVDRCHLANRPETETRRRLETETTFKQVVCEMTVFIHLTICILRAVVLHTQVIYTNYCTPILYALICFGVASSAIIRESFSIDICSVQRVTEC